ncbi:MAG: DEAD/DEAH box helicase [Candidatus Margulisiibacteriota bacterium]
MTLTLDLTKKRYPSHENLIKNLVDLGYVRVPMVLEAGEFSVRGSIIDVFAVNQTNPIRIDYFGESIERLNSFLVQTQRSLSELKKTTIAATNTVQKSPYFQPMGEAVLDDSVLSTYKIDDILVHEHYGVGRYKGLVRRAFAGKEGDFLWIQYKGEDRLFVPLDQLNWVHPYGDSETEPVINGLYDGSWKTTKKKAQKAVLELASDIYELYKQRQLVVGFACKEDSVWQLEQEATFPYKETQDQLSAIAAIKADMESQRPMDRLLCGEVGYGKTEVMLRAAFKAADNGKQVAIVAPTTLLAEQHLTLFKKRFEPFPIRVEGLSRFRSKKDQQAILDGLKRNSVDVVIGTHRLLQKDVSIPNLGLLILDEEQRFGVTHKEALKKAHPTVDVLSVSATPIPRTLYLSLTGSRDLSLISTPPLKRKPVLTAVQAYSDEAVHQAVATELSRGGQVFYIYNNVRYSAQRAAALQKILGNVTLEVAHAQMPEGALQKTMARFLAGEIQVLLCSTIIENGLDIPNANTIIIEKAENFGLSQIHQLRGRVGRTEKQGYAHLFYTSEETLSGAGIKRLQAIRDYMALGSGYKLALKDLELRGAGTMLGHRQSGHVTAVGFELYCKLLEDAVYRARGQRPPQKPTLHLEDVLQTYIPDDYIDTESERLAIYQRLMGVTRQDELDDLIWEVEDRYGQLPEVVKILFEGIRAQLR